MELRDTGLDTLLELDGTIIDQGDGYWVKMEAKRIRVTDQRPHGVKYSLTLHEPGGTRIMGFDNAHAIKRAGKGKYSGRRVVYDHRHSSSEDEGKAYEFLSAYQLIEDFWAEVDRVLKRTRYQ